MALMASAVAAMALAWPSIAQADHEPGDRRTRDVCHLRLRCSNTGSDNGESVYQPDPGWVIIDVKPVAQGFGQKKYETSYIQPRSQLASSSFVQSRFGEAVNAASQKGLTQVAADIGYEQNRALSRIRQLESSHKALVLSGSVAGEGLTRGGGSLTAHLKITEVFVGDEAYFLGRVAHWNRILANAGGPPPGGAAHRLPGPTSVGNDTPHGQPPRTTYALQLTQVGPGPGRDLKLGAGNMLLHPGGWDIGFANRYRDWLSRNANVQSQVIRIEWRVEAPGPNNYALQLTSVGPGPARDLQLVSGNILLWPQLWDMDFTRKYRDYLDRQMNLRSELINMRWSEW
jgi:hypothetical protein